jgi:hypothetical protein
MSRPGLTPEHERSVSTDGFRGGLSKQTRDDKQGRALSGLLLGCDSGFKDEVCNVGDNLSVTSTMWDIPAFTCGMIWKETRLAVQNLSDQN